MPTPKYALHLKGYVGGWDFDSDYVDFILSKNSGKEVSVLIDSLGGQLNTALSISSAFRRHGNVHAHFVGMNASAATIASMGARRITMDASAMYLVHQCSQSFFEWGSLNATDMQHLIDNLSKQKENLDKMDANVATMYASRCKKRPQDLLALMQKGGWLSAEEALAWGFVDELTKYDDEEAPVITEAIAADFKAHNIPVPVIPSQSNSSAANESKEELTAFRRFFLALSKAFHAQENQEKNNDTNPTQTMKKEYKTICQLLNQEAIETTDSQAAITAEQLDTIETELTTRNQMIASLTEKINALSEDKKSLEAKLASLPAASTQSVIDDKKPTNAHAEKSDIEQFIDTTNSAQALFNSLP